MSTLNRVWQFILVICLLLSFSAYADSKNTSENHENNVLYSPPLVREATAEWPDPGPEAKAYRNNDPEYYLEDHPKETVLDTQKLGNSHFIEVSFTGPTDVRIETQIMIDTGASFVALPMEMMDELDISDEDTVSRFLQTANGVIESFVTEVPLLEIGNQKIHDVEVAFVEDGSMGGLKLLGMNALKDYKVTIDNQNETLTLVKVE